MILSTTPRIELLHIDCMEYMAGLPDKAFDLAVVDPPYGIEIMKQWGSEKFNYKQHDIKEWDNAMPKKEYFDELFRVSKHQIIWGGNYFTQFLPASQGWLIWDKGQRNFSMADAEMAWTSFDKAIRIKTIHRSSQFGADIGKIHICQKPVKLYKWLLDIRALPGNRILDTHLGSGSSAIAAHKMGFDFVGCELDADYYKAACKRFEEQTMQLSLFKP